MEKVKNYFQSWSVEKVKDNVKSLPSKLKNLSTKSKIVLGLTSSYLFYVYLRNHGMLWKKSIKDQVALVTGAGSGIGKRLAILLAQKGARIVIVDIDIESATQTKEIIEKQGGKAMAIKCDVTNRTSIKQMKKTIQDTFGAPVTILVNNAGIVYGKSLEDLTYDQIDLTFKVNIISHFTTVKEFLPQMIEQKKGHIVTISSVSGIVGLPNATDYSASKWAAFGFNESLTFELAKKNLAGDIKTTVICPFYINTGMFSGTKIRFQFLMPWLEEEYVSKRICYSILQNEEVVVMHDWMSVFWLMRFFMPNSMVRFFYRNLAGYQSLDTIAVRKN